MLQGSWAEMREREKKWRGWSWVPVVPGPYQSKNIYSPAFTEHLLSGPGATKLVSDSLLHSRIYFSTGIYFVVQSNMCEASEPDGLGLNSGPRIEYLLNLGRYSSVPQFPLGNGNDNSTYLVKLL